MLPPRTLAEKAQIRVIGRLRQNAREPSKAPAAAEAAIDPMQSMVTESARAYRYYCSKDVQKTC